MAKCKIEGCDAEAGYENPNSSSNGKCVPHFRQEMKARMRALRSGRSGSLEFSPVTPAPALWVPLWEADPTPERSQPAERLGSRKTDAYNGPGRIYMGLSRALDGYVVTGKSIGDRYYKLPYPMEKKWSGVVAHVRDAEVAFQAQFNAWRVAKVGEFGQEWFFHPPVAAMLAALRNLK